MNLWQCPHPALFLKDICNSLESKQDHCIVSIPGRLIPSFQDELTSVWCVTHNPPQEVRLEARSSLIDILSPLFLLDSETPALDDLKEGLLKKAEMLIVVLPEAPLPIEKEFFDILLKDLMAHAKNCRDNDIRLDWTMLVIAPADRKIPDQDIGLKIFRWWGRLHNSDVDYAIEETFRDAFNLDTPKAKLNYWWLYPLCKGIAMSDPDLVEIIYHKAPQDIDTLMDALKDHELNTEENGILAKEFLDAVPLCPPSRSRLPQGLAAKLWHRGLLDLNCRGDMVLHPAALIAAGRRDALKKLIVYSQMQFFLPLIQEVLSLLRDKVENYWGADLETLIPKDGTLDSAPYEIGPFYALLGHLHRTQRKALPCQLHSTVKKWRDLRNKIAHINMLSRQTIEDAFISYEEIRKKDKLI